jgi:hypothetical protein
MTNLSRMLMAAAGGAGGAISVDLSNITYDSVVFNPGVNPDGWSQINPVCIRIKNDGTTFFVMSAGGAHFITQFTMSTAWDLSTASADNKRLDPAISGTSALNTRSFDVNPAGTRLFAVNSGDDKIFQYNLTTSWDASTASYASKYFQTTKGNAEGGLALQPDGSLILYVDEAAPNGGINEVTMSSTDDISTGTETGDEIVPTNDKIKGIWWNDTGTQLFQVREDTDLMESYTLGTAFDITTAVADSGTFDATSVDSLCRSIVLSSDSTKLYLAGGGGERIYQFSTNI